MALGTWNLFFIWWIIENVIREQQAHMHTYFHIYFSSPIVLFSSIDNAMFVIRRNLRIEIVYHAVRHTIL